MRGARADRYQDAVAGSAAAAAAATIEGIRSLRQADVSLSLSR